MSHVDLTGIMTADHYLLGSVVSTNLVIVVTAFIALETCYWTVCSHVFSWGAVIFYLCFSLSLNWLPLASGPSPA